MKLPTPVRDQLRRHFARQAESDLAMYDLLCREPLAPECQKLHYIQMALEKAVKAHLYGTIQELVTYHAVVRKHFLTIYRWYRSSVQPNKSIPNPLLYNMDQICHKIDMLCPAKPKELKTTHPVESLRNCEYPWIEPINGADTVISPLDFKFMLGSMLQDPEFVEIIKCTKFFIANIITPPPAPANP